MASLFNRRDELDALDERWASKRGEFMIVFGRRRVGKSRLITHWAESRRHLYYEATAGSERDHLDDISREIARVSGRRIYEEQPLTSWRAVFAALEELLDEGPILIALDEFQFLARSNAEIGSLVNDLIEHHKNDARLRLLIAGSDVSFFEQQVVGYAATSYGRRTGSLRLEPFSWSSIEPLVAGWSTEDRIRVWAIYGGMPYYLDEIDREADLGENIWRTVLIPDGLLRHEPEFLLAQESRIRERDTYMSALRAIAAGHTRLGEIAARIQRGPTEARFFLETLEDMRLVCRRYPVTKRGGTKVFYAITDPFLRFWFRFVAPTRAACRVAPPPVATCRRPSCRPSMSSSRATPSRRSATAGRWSTSRVRSRSGAGGVPNAFAQPMACAPGATRPTSWPSTPRAPFWRSAPASGASALTMPPSLTSF